MKKTNRQQMIKKILIEHEVETQEELILLLEKEGIHATQATISRDIREMRIVKMHGTTNRLTYAIFSQTEAPASSEKKLREALKESVIRVECVSFLVVIHTDMGNADVVTNYLDEVRYEEVAGTIAGVDTIVVIAYSKESAQKIVERINHMMC